MADDQTKNSALTTALAFHYQVLIGLEKCFSLEENQAIWFEKDGDVSFLAESSNESSQIEVKEYADSLTDNHENLWKTLKNWLAPEFNHNQYGALILHTTQAFGAKTRLKNWNNQNSEQRLQILKDIYNGRSEDKLNSENPSDIIKIQKKVIEADESLLLDLLKKVSLFTEADNAKVLEKNILSKLIGIPPNNLKSYLEGLVGFVYGEATKLSWSVNYKNFHAKCQELTTLFCKQEFTFPPFKGISASIQEVETHQDKLFVKKIIEIDHHVMISDAIGNWLELVNSMNEELDGHPLFIDKTIAYQEQLVKRFKLAYSNAQLEMIDSLRSSKLLYNNTIREVPLNIDNNIPPIEYKNGLIHEAMDDEDRDLKWKVDP
ncbi:hypothetical protein EA716_15585 [Acinetobacter baumannii]|uniref:hypothetical protein n=1 Tax=Acinetobacter baumannii TaxID=470 RepID=UPI000F748D81|nr:hypothetical protein [Acinetobacter baumannii]RSP92374.1 hypothetical protein EA716_15585 [Acinetobacter baumannii]